LEKVLGKTLGVPLFQEQAMRVAIECAGFTPGEADQLRRAMATFKFTGNVSKFKDKLVDGMIERGYEREFAEKTFSQLVTAFGEPASTNWCRSIRRRCPAVRSSNGTRMTSAP
jgi:DNA polymerase III alpha subunit